MSWGKKGWVEEEKDKSTRGWIGGAKDKLVSAGAKVAINHEISAFGQCTDLHIDTDAKTVQATLTLKEESLPMLVDVGGYTLYERNGKGYLRVESMKISKAWLNELAQSLLVGVEVRLPRAAYDLFKRLL